MYKLTKHHRKLAKVAARDPGRYALNGVLLDPRGVAVATDGQRLVAMGMDLAAGVRADDCHAMIVPVTELADGLRPLKKGGEAVVKNGTPERATIQVGSVAKEIELDNGKYPKYEDIISPQPPVHQITINADLLKGVLDAMPPNEEGKPAVTLGFGDPRRPLSVWAEGSSNGSGTLGVLMPLAGAQERDPVSDKPAQYVELRAAVTGQPTSGDPVRQCHRERARITAASAMYWACQAIATDDAICKLLMAKGFNRELGDVIAAYERATLTEDLEAERTETEANATGPQTASVANEEPVYGFGWKNG